MSTELMKLDDNIMSKIVLNGDLSGLNESQRVTYYQAYCARVGLDPVTKPFDVLNLSGKIVLYCTQSGAQQLNKLHGLSHGITSREVVNGAYVVTCRASDVSGRYTDSIGAVPIEGKKGEAYTNAIMKAETKAKRRATLDHVGLGLLDEEEISSIKGAQVEPIEPIKEIKQEESKDEKPDPKQKPIVDINSPFQISGMKTETIASKMTITQLAWLHDKIENKEDVRPHVIALLKAKAKKEDCTLSINDTMSTIDLFALYTTLGGKK